MDKYDLEDDVQLEFLDEEETYLDKLFFDLDFDPKFMDFINNEESIIDILNEICEDI